MVENFVLSNRVHVLLEGFYPFRHFCLGFYYMILWKNYEETEIFHSFMNHPLTCQTHKTQCLMLTMFIYCLQNGATQLTSSKYNNIESLFSDQDPLSLLTLSPISYLWKMNLIRGLERGL